MRGIVLLILAGGALGACSAPAAEEALDLRSAMPSVRAQAARSIGRARDKSALPALVATLKDPEKEVRREAVQALGALRDRRALPALLEALRDRDENVRFYAAYALGELQDAQAAEALLAAFGDPQWCVRDQAAWALREIHDPRIVAPLVAALADPKADAPHLVWILRQVGGQGTVEALTALLQRSDPTVRLRAVQALRAIGGDAAQGPLIAALTDADPAVRRGVLEAVLALGSDRIQEPLDQLLARETDPAVRAAAEQFLVRTSGVASLAAHWSFDDQNTKVAKDVTGGGTDGQITACTPVEGKVGHALQFGLKSCIELGKPAGMLSVGARPFTVMAWVKSEADKGVVVARGGAACGYSLYVQEGVPKFGIRRSQASAAVIAAGRDAIVGAWTHLAGVVKDDRIELYVNGKLAASAQSGGYLPGNGGQGMEIGFDVGNSAVECSDHFQGIIDEVKFFQAALAENAIAQQCRDRAEDHK